MVAVLESMFKREFLRELKYRLPACFILIPDPNTRQGLPDTLILCEDKWAALEFKASAGASRRPNQAYYIELLGQMSYASFVYPENREEVLDALHQTFYPRG